MKRSDFLKSMVSTPFIGQNFIISSIFSEFENLENTPTMPILFVGHGSPMNAIEENLFTKKWAETAKDLPKPKAIKCKFSKF